jgi:hypothetical protein
VARAGEAGLYYAASQISFALPPRLLLGRLVRGALAPRPAAAGGAADAHRLARITDVVGDLWPLRSRCLQRSLVLAWLLRRRGIDGRLRIGVQTDEGGLIAHAWVEVAGEPVNDTRDHCARYAAFEGADVSLLTLAKLERAT